MRVGSVVVTTLTCIPDFYCRMAALHQAALQGNVDCVNLLLNNGAHPDIQDNKGRSTSYPFFQCPCTCTYTRGGYPILCGQREGSLFLAILCAPLELLCETLHGDMGIDLCLQL